MFNLLKNQNSHFKQQYILAYIFEDMYAFNVENIVEIMLPTSPFLIEKDTQKNLFINTKGENIPVLIFGNLFYNNYTFSFEDKKILILEYNNNKLAVLMDAVGDIVNISDVELTDITIQGQKAFFTTFFINNKLGKCINTSDLYEYFNKNNLNFALSSTDIKLSNNNFPVINPQNALLENNSTYEIFSDNFFNDKYVVFTLNSELYAFNVEYVKEIQKINFSAITKIPCVPNFITGIINFRGNYISVIDIKAFLKISQEQYRNKLTIIVIKISELKIAILVDDVLDIANLEVSKINSNINSDESFIIGELLYNDNKFLNILNIEKLFSSENVSIENYE